MWCVQGAGLVGEQARGLGHALGPDSGSSRNLWARRAMSGVAARISRQFAGAFTAGDSAARMMSRS